MTVRLIALIAIPTFMAVLLAGGRVASATGDADVYQRVERLADLAAKTNALAHELEIERGYTAAYAASSPDPSQRSVRNYGAVRQSQGTTDKAVAEVRASAAEIDPDDTRAVRTRVRDILHLLDSLPAIREISTKTWMSADGGIQKYSDLIATLLDINDDVAGGITDQVVSATARAEAALARAKDQTTKESAILYGVLIVGRFDPAQMQNVQAARAQRESEITAFQTAASRSQRQLFEDTVSGSDVDLGETMRQQLVGFATASPTLSIRPLSARDARRWASYNTATINKMRTAEKQLVNSIGARIGTLKKDAQRSALVDGILLFILLALVLAITLLVARSLVRPLRKLRFGALDVANKRLPGLVERMRDPHLAGEVSTEIEPIDVNSADEIGEVARAFDEVHREAVRLAGEEAALRGNINAMFVNLSRRMQSLIERQLRLIDELEQSEQNDEQLASLFRLDHLATRMRRNTENLLVLGGQDQVRRWNQPVPLIDIIRASLSEVEQYERVGLRVQGELSIIGPVVNDLIHLVAELIENATVFSPDHTKVTLSGHLVSGGGAMLQITDNGVGMSAEELEAANWRLANPPVVDVSAARRMGLFVVGRLAQRHGIRVELRAALSGGLTAFVLLPGNLIAMGDAPAEDPRAYDPAGSQPVAMTAARTTGPAAIVGPGGPAGPGAPGGFGGPGFGGPGFGDSAPADRQDPRSRPSWEEQETRRSWEEQAPQPSWQREQAPQPSWQQEQAPQPSWEEQPGRPSWDQPAPRRPWDEPVTASRQEPPLPANPWDYPSHPSGPQQTVPGNGSHPGMPATGQTGSQPIVPEDGQPIRRFQTGPQPMASSRWDMPTGPQPMISDGDGPPPATQPRDEPGTGANRRPLPVRQPRSARQEHGAEQGPAQPPTARPAADPPAAGPPGRPVDPPVWDDSSTAGQGVSWGGAETAPKNRPNGRQERSPIFDAMESEWFQRRTVQQGTDESKTGWHSPADAGWQRAEAVQQERAAVATQTSSGLPKRVPGKNRVPGSVAAAAQPAPSPVAKPKDADQIRNRFSSLQQGVHRGRQQQSRPDDETGETA